VTLLPQLPRLLHQRLQENNSVTELENTLRQLLVQHKRLNILLMVIIAILLLQMASVMLG
jgi:hypothetical protein